jgi:DNA repair exonuclease SbcCD nuclease subunit
VPLPSVKGVLPCIAANNVPRRTLKLVHTSDVHLGCEFLPAADVEAAFRAVVDTAIATDADAVLVSGDLIDSCLVPDAVVSFAVAELGRTGRHCFVLPGNHDPYDDRSLYRRQVWLDRPPRIHLVDSDSDGLCVVPELELEVWGRPVVDHWRAFRPLEGIPPRAADRWRVAMAHGHVELPGEDERSSPIFPEQIAAAACDYIALGHWDRQVDVSQAGVSAHYSGAPTGPIGQRRALLITLEQGMDARVEPILLDRGVA